MTQTEHANGHASYEEQQSDRENLLESLSRLAPAEYHHTEESAALDVQVATARRYPRSLGAFLRTAKAMATIDQETAQSCLFALPRGGKNIAGPSIRLAEICACAWGHINVTVKITEIGDKWLTAAATAWDCEYNVRLPAESKRRITDKNGRRYNDDMLIMTCNAAASIAIRNAIFRVIPRAYIDQIYREARKVAVGDAKTLAATRASMVDYFNKMGVLTPRLLSAVDVPSVEDIGLEHIEILRGYATAIKDNQATVDECFPEQAAKQNLADKIKGKKPEEKAAEKKDEPAAPPTAELKPEPMTEQQQAEISIQCQRTGTFEAALNKIIHQLGVKKMSDMTTSEAGDLIKKLTALPTAAKKGERKPGDEPE